MAVRQTLWIRFPVGKGLESGGVNPAICVPANLDLPLRGWSLNHKGYAIYTSAAKGTLKRGVKMHRVVLERLLGRSLEPTEHVHHQDWNRLHNCPYNLVLMPMCLNPRSACRDPITGEFLSHLEYKRRYEPVDWSKVCTD